MNLTIYTDGGCLKNKRDANCVGACAFVVLDSCSNTLYSSAKAYTNTTNNRMELQAVINALTHLSIHSSMPYADNCTVFTDSKYVSNNYDEYLPKWKSNGWRLSGGGSVINSDLWREIDKLTPKFKSFRFQWVKGHGVDKFNIFVDKLVRDAMSRSCNSCSN